MAANLNRGNMQRVLLVHNYYQLPGGEDTVVKNEKRLLEEHGHEVFLYSRNNSELNSMGKLKKFCLPFMLIFNPRTYRDIKRLIREKNIGVVHVHNTLSLISPAVYYAARHCGVPVVQTVHNFRMLCAGAMFYRDGHICEDCVSGGAVCAIRHRCYRHSRLQTMASVVNTWIHKTTGIYSWIRYIALTEFNKNKILQMKQIGPEQVFIKPNFTFDGPQNTEAPYRKNGYYLFIGRVEEIKGIDLLLKAFSRLPHLQLKIAGTGADVDQYMAQATENVEFLGFRNRSQLDEDLAGCKAVIVPSQWYETFGMIIAEAYAAHRPVIVGDVGNIATLVDDEATGLKFEYNRHEALEQALIRFEAMDGAEMGENGYRKYSKHYSAEVNYQMLKDVYDRL